METNPNKSIITFYAFFVLMAGVLPTQPVYAGPYETAVSADDRKDYETALLLYRPLAEQGNGLAQYKLGRMYSFGHGVAVNQEEAAKWFRKSADQGVVDAQYNLGRAYELGYGVQQNIDKATKWYKKAADQGDTEARDKLATIKQSGSVRQVQTSSVVPASQPPAKCRAPNNAVIDLPKEACTSIGGSPLGVAISCKSPNGAIIQLDTTSCSSISGQVISVPSQTVAESANQGSISEDQDRIVFINSSTFDEDLSRILKDKKPIVTVFFVDSIGLNSIPERLETWLVAVKKLGGQVSKQAVKPQEVATRFLPYIKLIMFAVDIVRKIADEYKYTGAGNYDAVIRYREDNGAVIAVDFRLRK